MKPILTAILAASLLSGCGKPGPDEKDRAKEPAPSSEKQGILELAPAAQQRLGLSIQALAAARVQPQVQAFGHVLDPSPLLKLGLDLQAAKATSDASQAEYDRKKRLHENQNASTSDLQKAQAAALRDQIQLETLRAQLSLEWGRLGQQTNFTAWMEQLAQRQVLLVRFDIPPAETLSQPPPEARLITLADETHSVPVSFVALATRIAPETQTEGLIYLAKTNAVLLAPGAAVIGYLPKPGQMRRGVLVPRAAVVRAEGRAWVYSATATNQFARNEIFLEFPLGDGWFVERGVGVGDRVVTTGSSALFSEETKRNLGAD